MMRHCNTTWINPRLLSDPVWNVDMLGIKMLNEEKKIIFNFTREITS